MTTLVEVLVMALVMVLVVALMMVLVEQLQTMLSVVARVLLVGKVSYPLRGNFCKLFSVLIQNLTFPLLDSSYLRQIDHYHTVRLPASIWPGYFDTEYSRPEGTMGYTFTC